MRKLILLITGAVIAPLVLLCACSDDGGGGGGGRQGGQMVIPENTLPVVFHVLYESATDLRQNPSTTLIKQRFTQLNQFYAATLHPNMGSTATKIKFMLATHDPSGVPMAEPGINRVLYSGADDIDPGWFIQRSGGGGSLPSRDKAINWDQNKYINIWIFGFKPEPGSSSVTTGISILPYSLSGSLLEGLQPDWGGHYLTRLPNYMHGIALNNNFFSKDEEQATLFHEMGHYVGLLHAFIETGPCLPTSTDYSDDYCDDTPTYSRDEYEAFIFSQGNALTAEQAYTRRSCSTAGFMSTNVMDYVISFRSNLTPDQNARINHVYAYSPLIPRSTKGTKALLDNYTGEFGDEIPKPIIMRNTIRVTPNGDGR